MSCSFDSIKIGMASPEQIISWSHGEVTKPDTVNYKTLKPEKGGLFCEQIFGPTKDWECSCGKFRGIQYKGKVCDRCGVEVTHSKVRRERMGHIVLSVPVSHVWYFKGVPSKMGLLVNMTAKDLEKVIYYQCYVIIDPGDSPYEIGQIMTPEEYAIYSERYKDLKADMGAEAIREILQNIDLDKLHERLVIDLKSASGQKRLKLIKRLEIVDDMIKSGNKPEWMILTVLPVIPPDLRPMVQLDGGRFATADLNDLYRRVITRNNRLKRLMEKQAPDVIIRNEERMLQEAVDSLIDNGRHGRPITGKNNRSLKSLSDLLKGKQGRFRQNLLGKRVDYSGRSVIVVGPELKIYQCGVPKEMALELFKPFIMRKLVEDKKAGNIKSAKKMIDKGLAEVWDALDVVIKDHPVMLNRAPTLHRLGIQAFEPVLVDGHALKLHPLNCTAFNADFDGDQMAIHVPLSAEAQAEARILMLSSNNLLRPQDGGPVTVPTQDMVLGSYYLTMERIGEAEKGAEFVWCTDSGDTELKAGELVNADTLLQENDRISKEGKQVAKYISRHIFSSENEAMMAYNNGYIGIHCPIRVRHTVTIDGVEHTKVVSVTPGRIIFNGNIPQDIGFVDRTDENHICDYEIGFICGKKELGVIVDRVINKHGFTVAAEVLDAIKSTGYKYSTRAAITVSIWDMSIPDSKYRLVDEAEKAVVNIENMYKMGFMTDHERYKQVIDIWESTTEKVSDELQLNLDRYNPVFMMADSGARGSMKQIRQLAGMRGLIANTAGKTIEIPIKANYREGLTALEYFNSSRGARKGLADTALRTADSGYLTRRMVDVSQEVIITQHDCGVYDGIKVSDIIEDGQVIERLEDRIRGRFLVGDIIDLETNEVLLSSDKMLTVEDASLLRNKHWKQDLSNVTNVDDTVYSHDPSNKDSIPTVMLRSVITCKSHHGVCAKCYGMNLATQQLVGLGEAVGVIAAQSIGEPGTQLTMRTFHTGGLAGGDITQGLPRVEELFEARKPKRMAILSEIDGKVTFNKGKGSLTEIQVVNDKQSWKCSVPRSMILVKDGTEVKAGTQLTYGALYPSDVLRICGENAVYTYLTKEVLKVYHQQGVDINDKHIEVIVRQMTRKIQVTNAGDTNLIDDSVIDVPEFEEENDKINKDGTKATGNRLIFGITKSALNTGSFLSAASFQETTKVLSESAIKGKVDKLCGLKENVIIGKLIPAGTGLSANQVS